MFSEIYYNIIHTRAQCCNAYIYYFVMQRKRVNKHVNNNIIVLHVRSARDIRTRIRLNASPRAAAYGL